MLLWTDVWVGIPVGFFGNKVCTILLTPVLVLGTFLQASEPFTMYAIKYLRNITT